MMLTQILYIDLQDRFHSPSKKHQSESQLKTLVWQPNYVSITKTDKLLKNFKHSGRETDKNNRKAANLYLQKTILKKKKFCIEESYIELICKFYIF